MSVSIGIGAQSQIFINGEILATAISFSWSSETQSKDIYGLDQMEPYEFANTINRVTGSCSLYRIIGDGGLEGAGIVARFSDILRQKLITITVKDILTDSVLFEATNCVVPNQNWEIRSKDLITGSFSFKGKTWGNEVQETKT